MGFIWEFISHFLVLLNFVTAPCTGTSGCNESARETMLNVDVCHSQTRRCPCAHWCIECEHLKNIRCYSFRTLWRGKINSCDYSRWLILDFMRWASCAAEEPDDLFTQVILYSGCAAKSESMVATQPNDWNPSQGSLPWKKSHRDNLRNK